MRSKKKARLAWSVLGIGLMVIGMAVHAAPSREDIWRDDFNRPPGDNVGNGWSEFEATGSDASIAMSDGRYALKLSNDNTYVTRMIPITGYSNVEIVWEVRGSPAQKPYDVVRMHITKDGGQTWQYRVAVFLVYSKDGWPSYSVLALNPDYYVPGFGIRLSLDLDLESSSGSSDTANRDALVDYLILTGIPSGDTVPPLVTNVAATPDPQTFDGDVLIAADVTDNAGIASVEYTLDGGSNWTAMTLGTGSTYTATLDGPFVGNYSVCVRATDTASPPNTSDGTACDTFAVTAAQLGIAFAGQELDLDGAPTQLKAEVTGPCSSGAEVEFFAAVGSGYASVGTADTDTSGVATVNAVLPVGVHDIKVTVGDQDMDPDSAPECKGDTDIGITVVADPKASSTGGGWYKVDVDATPPRVNFGYTAQRKFNKKLDEYSTSGNLLWMHQDSYRLKGVIDSGGMLPEEMCDPEFAACAAFAGEGTLYEHNPAYDPACLPTEYCGLEWINPSPNTPFVIFVNDGGTSRECVSKKKCKDVEKPDQFGIEIELESIPAESDPVYLNGGNLVVR
jgi:hypothetical protein